MPGMNLEDALARVAIACAMLLVASLTVLA